MTRPSHSSACDASSSRRAASRSAHEPHLAIGPASLAARLAFRRIAGIDARGRDRGRERVIGGVFFSYLFAQALAQQANALLVGDAVIAADHPPRAECR